MRVLFLLLLVSLINLPVVVMAVDDAPKKTKYKLSEALAREAVEEVVSVYQNKGIEAALSRADELREELAITPYLKNPDHPQQEPDFEMEIAMWYEANLRSGKKDPVWSLAIFKWIDGHWTSETTSNLQRIGPLSINLYSKMRNLGLLGEAHMLILEMEDALKEDGLNTLTSKAPDLGPWNSSVPAIRKRPFPVHYPKNQDRHYRWQYFSAMGRIASLAYDEGNWKRSAELSLWVRKYASTYIEDNPRILSHRVASQSFETLGMYESSTNQLANYLAWNGEYAQAVELLDEMIERSYRTYGGTSHDYGQIYREYLLLKIKQVDQDSLERVASIHQDYINNKFTTMTGRATVTMLYSELLQHFGHTGEAWKLLNDFESNLNEHELNALNTIRLAKIKLALATNDLDQVEKWILESLAHVRSRALKMDEPELYELYAQYKAAKEQYADAARLIREAGRLYRGLDIPFAIDRTNRLLITYQNGNKSDKTTDGQPLMAKLDLQPVQMSSDALLKQYAYGRFALSNLGPISITGTLKLEGKIDDLIHDENGSGITVVTDDQLPTGIIEVSIELLPNDQVLIDTVAIAPPQDSGALKLSFKQEDEPTQQAVWYYKSSGSRVTKTFINASLVEDSPFYLVPVFHTLQRSSIKVNAVSNFRFVAATPMRIEVYDSVSGQLIYIDANGDGDLMDPGDQLSTDNDRNGKPDVTFEADSLVSDIELHFHAPDMDTEEYIELKLQLSVDGQWETQCVDLISLKRQ